MQSRTATAATTRRGRSTPSSEPTRAHDDTPEACTPRASGFFFIILTYDETIHDSSNRVTA